MKRLPLRLHPMRTAATEARVPIYVLRSPEFAALLHPSDRYRPDNRDAPKQERKGKEGVPATESSPLAVHVLLCLYAHAEGGQGWTTVRVLARSTGAFRRSVKRALRFLEGTGWLSTRRQPGSKTKIDYTLRLPGSAEACRRVIERDGVAAQHPLLGAGDVWMEESGPNRKARRAGAAASVRVLEARIGQEVLFSAEFAALRAHPVALHAWLYLSAHTAAGRSGALPLRELGEALTFSSWGSLSSYYFPLLQGDGWLTVARGVSEEGGRPPNVYRPELPALSRVGVPEADTCAFEQLEESEPPARPSAELERAEIERAIAARARALGDFDELRHGPEALAALSAEDLREVARHLGLDVEHRSREGDGAPNKPPAAADQVPDPVYARNVLQAWFRAVWGADVPANKPEEADVVFVVELLRRAGREEVARVAHWLAGKCVSGKWRTVQYFKGAWKTMKADAHLRIAA